MTSVERKKRRSPQTVDLAKIENTTLMREHHIDRNDYVFIHSSFRSGSTWLWSKFRGNRNTVSYYEYFNDGLSTINALDLESSGPHGWDSRHPHTSAYFLEFLPFLRSSGGIDGFDRSMSLDNFVPAGGLSGELSQLEIDYVSRLVGLAQASRRVPVLTETRTLGRIAALRRAFGGTHVLLYRNLFQQWASYCYFLDHDNPYFFAAMLQCLRSGRTDPFIAKLEEYGKRLIKDGPEDLTVEEWLSKIDADSLFVLFAGFHVYLLMQALNQADIIVDITKLARQGPEARHNLQIAIRQATGLSVDLSDVADSIEAPAVALKAPDSVRETLDSFFRLAVRLCETDSRQIAFGEEIIDSLWQEHDRYAFYTRSLGRLITHKRNELEAIRRQHDEETHARANAERAEAEAVAESVRLRDELGALRAKHIEEVTELRRISAAEAEAAAESARLRDELEALKAKHIEEVTELRRISAAEAEELRKALAQR